MGGFLRCDVSGRAVPKDKAIKRFIVRNMVDASGQKDLKDASYYDRYMVPKMYYKGCYCVSAAIHQRIVRPRNRQERKNRNPPPQVLKRWAKEAKRQREREKQQHRDQTLSDREHSELAEFEWLRVEPLELGAVDRDERGVESECVSVRDPSNVPTAGAPLAGHHALCHHI